MTYARPNAADASPAWIGLYLDVGKGTCNSNRSNKLAISGTTPFPHTSTLLRELSGLPLLESGVLSATLASWWCRISLGTLFFGRKDIRDFLEKLVAGGPDILRALICGKEIHPSLYGSFYLMQWPFSSRPKFHFFLQLKVRYPWDEVRTLVLNQSRPTEVIGRLPRCNSDVFLPHLTKSLHLSRVQMVEVSCDLRSVKKWSCFVSVTTAVEVERWLLVQTNDKIIIWRKWQNCV